MIDHTRWLSSLPAEEREAVHGPPPTDLIRRQDYLSGFLTPSTFNHERKRLSAILKPAYAAAGLPNPITQIPKRREKATLHKPIRDVAAVLEDIKAFNPNLHLCCLLTYGCLLRPHQEIRQLTWGDFDEQLTRISLSGSRNKSGRNRIVPIPQYVAMHLPPWGCTPPPSQNIFSRVEKPFNADYFKSLWTRYKAQSSLISPDQTLYSFRHTGAISVYREDWEPAHRADRHGACFYGCHPRLLCVD